MNPRHSAYRAVALPTVQRCLLAEQEINPYNLTQLQMISFFRVVFLNDIFHFLIVVFFYGCPQLILFICIVFFDISIYIYTNIPTTRTKIYILLVLESVFEVNPLQGNLVNINTAQQK